MLAYEAGILSREAFLNLCVSTMMSIILCCAITVFIDDVFKRLSAFVSGILDAPSKKERHRLAERFRAVGVVDGG